MKQGLTPDGIVHLVQTRPVTSFSFGACCGLWHIVAMFPPCIVDETLLTESWADFIEQLRIGMRKDLNVRANLNFAIHSLLLLRLLLRRRRLHCLRFFFVVSRARARTLSLTHTHTDTIPNTCAQVAFSHDARSLPHPAIVDMYNLVSQLSFIHKG